MAAKKTRAAAKSGAGDRPPRLIDMPFSMREIWKYDETDEFFALLFNSVSLEHADGTPAPYREQVFFKREIFGKNAVGYMRVGDLFCAVTGVSLDEYRFPKYVNLMTGNGRPLGQHRAAYDMDLNGVYIIYGMPVRMSMAAMVAAACDELNEIAQAVRQNIRACKTPFYIVTDSPDKKLSIEQAIQSQQNGDPVVVVDEGIGDGIRGIQPATQYIADKLYTMWADKRDLLLNKLGIITANTDKRERVQVGEVNATFAQCFDYVKTLTDNVNAQFDAYGIDRKLIYNGSTRALFGADVVTDESDGMGEIIND